jgi:hypothetical protein
MKFISKNVFSKKQKLHNIFIMLIIVIGNVFTINVYAEGPDNDPPQISSPTVRPDPKYSPEDVIRFQIEALAQNDDPYENAGIEFAFRFASPTNKRATGPLERFIRLVNNPLYQPMLNHQTADYGEIQVNGEQAVQIVVLTTSSGKRVGYVFTLSRQKDDTYEDCWMTDSVVLLPQFDEV